MTVGWVALAASVVGTAASITAGKKTARAQKEAAQEAAYIEGAAPSIPVANELAIETIGEAEELGATAPDFREALEGTYGGGMYDTQDFQSGQQQQIPPELEALLMQQQSTGMEPTNVQFARTGGPVGLPQDVYHFSVPKISQMQMDVDPGVRNVGNAMMAQMEGNPGMGMVSASAADIDQMAAGGSVQPRRYEDGSTGGIRAAVREAGLKELQALRPKNILKGATVGQIESAGDVLAAEGFKEKALELGDFVPGGERVNPLRHLRSLLRRRRANKEAKELEELEAEARVFGPR
tara:strand:- start:3264 stop:4145 length:882 start_codon:yes stop_codon:yes gene_type:complete